MQPARPGSASLYGTAWPTAGRRRAGRRIWDHVRGRASSAPEEFTPHTRDGVTGWLWEGPFATLIREAVPGITDTDLRRAREYLNACGMVVNVRANQRGAQPQWFIRAHWHHGPGGHVHVVPTARPGQPRAPSAAKPEPAGQSGGSGAPAGPRHRGSAAVARPAGIGAAGRQRPAARRQ